MTMRVNDLTATEKAERAGLIELTTRSREGEEDTVVLVSPFTFAACASRGKFNHVSVLTGDAWQPVKEPEEVVVERYQSALEYALNKL